MSALAIVTRAASVGFAELPATYTVRSWVLGWLVRVVFQVIFYTMLGQLAGSSTVGQYVLLGNAVAVAALESTFVTTTAAAEQSQGTFALLVTSPTRMGLVYLGRGLHWVIAGTVSSTVVLLVSSFFYEVQWHWWQALALLPLLALIGLSAYFYGGVISSLVLRNLKYRAAMASLGFLLLATFCGVNVPVSFWPHPLDWLAQVLPLTHGLAAVRILLTGGPAGSAAVQVLLEAAVAIGWALATLIAFERLASRGRRDGSLSFAG